MFQGTLERRASGNNLNDPSYRAQVVWKKRGDKFESDFISSYIISFNKKSLERLVRTSHILCLLKPKYN